MKSSSKRVKQKGEIQHQIGFKEDFNRQAVGVGDTGPGFLLFLLPFLGFSGSVPTSLNICSSFTNNKNVSWPVFVSPISGLILIFLFFLIFFQALPCLPHQSTIAWIILNKYYYFSVLDFINLLKWIQSFLLGFLGFI